MAADGGQVAVLQLRDRLRAAVDPASTAPRRRRSALGLVSSTTSGTLPAGTQQECGLQRMASGLKWGHNGAAFTAADGRHGASFQAQLEAPAGVGSRIEVDRFKARALRMRKSIITGARLHVQEATQAGFRGRWAMVTATYREGVDARPRHVSDLVACIRRYLARLRGRAGGFRARFVWALELTKRLRPHYHLLVWLAKGVTLPKPDKRGWWPHGMTRIEAARNAVGYLAKYASKFNPETAFALPKGMRTHGVGGLNDESARELRWWRSPTAAREALGALADIRKVLGGYADKRTGLFWPSPWRVFVDNLGRVFVYQEVPA